MMKRAIAFITFEQLVTKSQIELKYQQFCDAHQQQNNVLGLIAARHKFIYEFWYNHVIHFCFMLLVASSITHLAISKISIPAVAMAGLLFFE